MLKLRPYKNADAKTILSWIKDEKSFHQWCADRLGSYPPSAETLNAHYEEGVMLPFVAYDESGLVGHFFLRFMNEEKTFVRIGFVIVDSVIRGKGYGRQMIQLALKYAFEFLQAENVSLGVFENNPAAYRCYKAAGFKDLTTTHDCHVLGEEWNCLELDYKRTNWQGQPDSVNIG